MQSSSEMAKSAEISSDHGAIVCPLLVLWINRGNASTSTWQVYKENNYDLSAVPEQSTDADSGQISIMDLAEGSETAGGAAGEEEIISFDSSMLELSGLVCCSYRQYS